MKDVINSMIEPIWTNVKHNRNISIRNKSKLIYEQLCDNYDFELKSNKAAIQSIARSVEKYIKISKCKLKEENLLTWRNEICFKTKVKQNVGGRPSKRLRKLLKLLLIEYFIKRI